MLKVLKSFNILFLLASILSSCILTQDAVMLILVLVLASLVLVLVLAGPVLERVFFSQSGLIMRAHRARMTDHMLQTMVYLKCNSHI